MATPSREKSSRKGEKVKRETVEGYIQQTEDLVTVNGYYTPEGLTYKGKRILPGIFVNVTGKNEKEKEDLFERARREIREEAEGLPLYEVINVKLAL